MGHILYIWRTLCVAIFVALSLPATIQEQSKNLNTDQFVFWNVGQGDQMSYFGPDVCWFFDLGGDHPLSLQNLMSIKHKCQGKRNEAFLSHFDKDHIQFYKSVDQVLFFTKVYVSHLDVHTKMAARLITYFSKKGASIEVIYQGKIVKSQHVQLKCLWPLPGPKRDENSQSLTFIFSFLGKKFNGAAYAQKILLTGDLPGKIEKHLNLEPVSILKVAHHGSQTSTFDFLLKSIRPKTCIISVGERNKYGHPKKELLKRLTESRCATLRTDKLGHIKVEL